MKRIDKHIAKGFLKSFSLSLLAFLNIFLISQIFRVIKYVSDGKMTVHDSVIYFFTLIPGMLVDISPLSVLLGGLISMNVMASNLEIISLKTSGISFKRIIVFPVLISALISLGIYKISDSIAPEMYEKSRVLRGSDKENEEVPTEKQDAFLRGESNYVYFMKKINRVTGVAQGVEIIDLNDDFTKIERVIIAKQGKYDEKRKAWNLNDVYITRVQENTSKEYKEFSDLKYKEEPGRFITLGKNPKTLSIGQLKKEMKVRRAVGKDIKEFTQELSKRYSYPFASFFICFI
ncbi:MAG: LptF/LptG family permease, partial [Fusobacteriaceae bacterium]